ncbi:MAG: haloalkane dehalogenase [Pseudomonadota bacterium]
MKQGKAKQLYLGVAGIALALAGSVQAQTAGADDGLAPAGLWYDPGRDGEGFNVVESAEGTTVYFYGYDAEGEALWLISETLPATLRAGEEFTLAAFRGQGGSFAEPLPGSELAPWGSVTIRIDDCSKGLFELDGEDGVKRSQVVKLAGVDGHYCSLRSASGRGAQYCEILLFYPTENGRITAEVWGTQLVGDCPADLWQALDADAIQAEYGALLALLNGPREIAVDGGQFSSTGSERRSYGGIEMAQQAQLTVTPTDVEDRSAYTEASVARVNVFEQWAGTASYELVSDEGVRYVMYSTSQEIDPDLTIADLAGLGERLDLPEGWTWAARTLEEDLIIETQGEAIVLQDDFRNSYQRIDESDRFGLAGLWFDPTRDGEGFNVIQSEAGTTIYYYGYADSGSPLWLVSDTIPGTIGTGDTRAMNVYARGHGAEGGSFDAPLSGGDLEIWGRLIVQADGCGEVRFELDGVAGTKRSDTTKLAGIDGNDCIEPEVLVTADGIEFVRTPDDAFADLPDWPYEARYVEIDGLRQAYVDEGPADGPVVLLLHGQPSWSYLYRKMIPVLAEGGYRVIAMDHLGMGRSDKPIDVDAYSYLGHSDRLERFIDALALRDINLFVQDWGSLIGLRVAGLNPDWFATIAVGDGALPNLPAGVEPFPPVQNPDEALDVPSLFTGIPDQQVPFYDGCEPINAPTDNSYFGVWMEYAMKGVSFTPSEVVEANTWFDLPADEEAAYDAPYPSRLYLAGARKFPSLINDVPGTTAEATDGLYGFERPFLTIWASNDPGQLGSCDAQQVFIDNVPGAADQPHVRLPEASHFLQDDQGVEIARRLTDFYLANGIPPAGKSGGANP